MKSRSRLFASGVVCCLVAILLHWNTLNCGIVYDDEPAIKKNQDLRPEGSWLNLLYHDFWGSPMSSKTSHKSYRPLCVATFRLNYLLHELQPMGYHLVNVLLHGAVCYLYVQLCGVVFSRVWPALIAGLLFAVHPIHTEAVAGLVGRTEILSGFFYSASFLFYHKAAVSQHVAWMCLVVVCCLCAVVSKEQGITVVGVCVVYEYFFLHKMGIVSGLKLLRTAVSDRHHLPSWFCGFLVRVGILVVFSVSFLVLRVQLMQGGPDIFQSNINPPIYMDTPYRQLSWIYLTFINSWLLLNPTHLCPDWRFGLAPLIHSVTDPHNLLSLVTMGTVTALAVYGVKHSSVRSRTLLLGLALMIIPFLPASNLFFPVGFVVAERVLYLPSMGFCMLVAYGAWKLLSRNGLLNRFVKLSLFYLLAVHFAKAVLRNRAWYSNYELFSSATAAFPGNGKMVANLGTWFDLHGNRTVAISLFNRSIEIEPHLLTGYMNLAYAQRETEQYMEALETYRRAAHLVTRNLEGDKTIHITPKNIRVYNSLSNMLREHGSDLQGALFYARKAVKLEPVWANTHNTLANALLALEVYHEAKSEFERAIALNPKMGVAHSNLGDCLIKLGDLTSAERHLREALTLEPNHTLSKFRLASIAIKSNTQTTALLLEAENLLLDVLELEPENGNASLSLGLVYHDLRNTTEAEKWFLRSLEISPNDLGSRYNLGVMLTNLHRYSEAIIHLEALLEQSPSHANGLTQLATCHMQMGHTHKAKEMFQRVLKMNPNQTMTLQNYGVLLLNERDYVAAIEVFQHLHRLDPTNAAVKQQITNLLKVVNKPKSSDQPSGAGGSARERGTKSNDHSKSRSSRSGRTAAKHTN